MTPVASTRPPTLVVPLDAGATPPRTADERGVIVPRGALDETTGWQQLLWLDDHRLLLAGSDVRVYDVTTRAASVLDPSMARAQLLAPSRVLVMGEHWNVFSAATLTKTATLDCDAQLAIGPRDRIACRKGNEARVVDLGGSPPRPIPSMTLEDDTWVELAARLRGVRAVTIDANVIWRADTGEPIVSIDGATLAIGGGRYVYATGGGGAVTALALGEARARTYRCDGASSYAVDPKLPVIYGTLGPGHVCTIDLVSGRTTSRGAPPPRARRDDCCGSPHLSLWADGLALQNGGFAWSTLVDARTGVPLSSGGAPASGVAFARAGGALLFVSDQHHDELVSFDVKRRVETWRRPVFATTGAALAPQLSASHDGKRVAMLRGMSDAEPTIVDVTSGRILSPPDALDAALFGDDGALYTRAASGAVQRWDLARGSVTDAASFPQHEHGVRAALRERCAQQTTGPELDASPDGTMTACFRNGRVVIVVSDGDKRIELEPHASEHGGIVHGDDDSFDLVGNESAVAAGLSCRAAGHDLPLDACAPRLRRRGLLALEHR